MPEWVRPLRDGARVLLAGVVVAGCARPAATGLVLEVASDLVVPDEVDRLGLRVSAAGRTVFDQIYALGSGPALRSLPARLGLVPEGGTDGEVTIDVVVRLGEADVVGRRVVTQFLPGSVRVVRVDLLRACAGAACASGQTCVPQSGCTDPHLDPAGLPPFDPAHDAASLPSSEPSVEAPDDGPGPDGPDPDGPPMADSSPMADAPVLDAPPKLDAPVDLPPGVEPPKDAPVDLAPDLAVDSPPSSSGWVSRTPTPRPASWPEGRSSFSMVYDASRARVVVWGGRASTTTLVLDQMWEWDGSAGTWAQRTQPSTRPPLRHTASTVYDSDRHTMLVFGGNPFAGSTTGYLGDTWEWNGAVGTWTLRASSGPPVSYGSPIAYDRVRKRAVLFQGGYSSVAAPRTVWEWDGAAGIWTSVWSTTATTGVPPDRIWAPMDFDAKRARTVMFGGHATSVPQNDLWEWDGVSWVERVSPSRPAPRYGHAIAFRPSSGTMLAFAGRPTIATYVDSLQDTWLWDGAAGTWADLTPTLASSPAGRRFGAMVYDESRDVFVVFGGSTNVGTTSVFFDDLWEFKP